jgi:cysteinyl-tRNA synthetase
MDDDFNTAGALAALFDLVRVFNGLLEGHAAGPLGQDLALAERMAETLVELMGVLGLTVEAPGASDRYPAAVVDLARDVASYTGADPGEAVEELLALRATARSAKDWATADTVRDGLSGLGLTVEDTPSGARVVVRQGG